MQVRLYISNMYYYYGQLIMKNKDYYNLNTIDYYQLDEETITIYHIGYQNNTIAIIEKYFDEPPLQSIYEMAGITVVKDAFLTSYY